MSVATVPGHAAGLSEGIPPEPVVRLSVDDYHAMERAGILNEGAPVELLEGWLVQKMTKYPQHDVSLGCTADAFEDLSDPKWHVRSQGAVMTSDSEPEPDVALTRGRRRDFTQEHPGPDDIAIIVEIAESSLSRDRTWKKRIYAAAGFPVYWIVNLIDECVEVFESLSANTATPDYASHRVFHRGDLIPVCVDGSDIGQVAVDELLS
jgi:Uma2 family endonuclease